MKWILQNRVYNGTFVFNKYSRSKYYHYANGVLVKGARKGLNAESDWIVRENNHDPIIKKAEFDKAQTLLAKGKTGRSPHTPENNPYLFNSDILRCGRCQGPMWGRESERVEQSNSSDPNEHYFWTKNRYECGKCKDGKRWKEARCEGTCVREDILLTMLVRCLRKEFSISEELGEELWDKAKAGLLSKQDLPEGFAKLKRMMIGKLPKQPDTKRMEKEIKELESKLKTGENNLVLLDPKRIPAAEKRLMAIEERLAELRAQVKHQPTESDLNQSVKQVLNKLYRLSLANHPRVVKPAIRQLLLDLEHLTVYTSISGNGTCKRHKLTQVKFQFRSVGGVTGTPYRTRVGRSFMRSSNTSRG